MLSKFKPGDFVTVYTNSVTFTSLKLLEIHDDYIYGTIESGTKNEEEVCINKQYIQAMIKEPKVTKINNQTIDVDEFNDFLKNIKTPQQNIQKAVDKAKRNKQEELNKLKSTLKQKPQHDEYPTNYTNPFLKGK